MMQKFGRNYRLTIDPKDGQPVIIIRPPFTCRFAVKRDILASVNNAYIDVYNLSRSNRRRIFQDRNNLQGVEYTAANGEILTARRSAKLEIGYGGLIYTVWEGDIFMASSSREGVDIITHIESLTGIYEQVAAPVSITLAAGGLTLTKVFYELANQMIATQQPPVSSIGYISNFDDIVFARGITLNGPAWQLIQQYAKDPQGQQQSYKVDTFIDNNQIFIMKRTDKISNGGPVPILNAASGLLDTPRREQAYISVTTLLEANIQINSLVQIDSVIEPAFNGQYSVIGIQHTGTISDAVAGDCRSTFFLLAPQFNNYNQVMPQ